jgi:uncharacterized protein
MEPDPQPQESMDEAVASADLFRWGMVLEGGLAVLAAVVGWSIGFNPTGSIVLSAEALPRHAAAVGWGVAAAAPMILMLWVINRFPAGPLGGLERLVEERVTPLFAEFTIEQMALLSAMAGIGEEVLFRGLIQGGMIETIDSPHRVGIGLAVASVAFGLCHYLSKTYFLLTTMIGLYLGWLYLWTGNLLAPITTHAVYDFAALVYLVRWKNKQGQREADGQGVE